MKRAGNLIEAVASADNLRLAYLRAARGKRMKADVRLFASNLHDEIRDLGRELASGTVAWGGYHRFEIHDPKRRTICAAPFRDRVAHHALINVCEPYFESYQIHDSYACRRGKGLDAALRRSLAFARGGGWHLKLDIRKHFDSISHAVLLRLLRRRFKDLLVLEHFEAIVVGYQVQPGRGLPIGNLTSQYFANHVMARLDHFVKEDLRCRRYLRYMDDFVLWADDRRTLRGWRDAVVTFLAAELELELNPAVIDGCERGLTYLGYRIFPAGLRLSRRSRRRFRRKLAEAVGRHREGEWTQQDLARHAEPMLAFIRRGASYAFRERVLRDLGLDPWARSGCSAAVAGTTTPGTAGPRIATTTTRATGTTTTASAWPAAQPAVG